MQKFDIITEADARVLPRGGTVMLARGGHITPLAADTLNERRVTVVEDGKTSADDATLVPRADIRSVAIASDHTGIALRRALVTFLRGRGLAVQDLGTEGTEPVDYPDIAASVAFAVARGEADAGIVIDGAGIGSAIAANKVDGIRDVLHGDDRQIFTGAQRRQRDDARRHARQRRRGARHRHDLDRDVDAGTAVYSTSGEDPRP
jgi:RpiB/LacA/LacB family sugar-phosphate isomerase